MLPAPDQLTATQSTRSEAQGGTMRQHRIISTAAACLAFAAIAAPVASARPDIGPPAPAPSTQQDLSGFYRPVAPDAPKSDSGVQLHRSAPSTSSQWSHAAGPTQPAFGVDMRSPDARDAARGVYPHGGTPVVASASKADGTDWSKVGIIGGSALGGLLLVGLGFALFTRRTPVLTR
jgi:hypothetical protein